MLPLVRDGSCWTLGADSADINHEAAWRQSLRRDHCCRFKGDCKPPGAAAAELCCWVQEPDQHAWGCPTTRM